MNTTQKKSFIQSCALIALACLFCFAVAAATLQNVANRITTWAEFEAVSVSNSNFSSGSGHSLTAPSGWTAIGTIPSYARAGVVDVTSAAFASYGNSTTESSSYYMLTTQPTKMNSSYDDKILMINARNNSYAIGYKSSQISLTANSHYIITVLARAEENATFSIYLSGLDEEYDAASTYISSTEVWAEYKFFVKTGLEPQNTNIELWLGTKTGFTSKNAVFFDNVDVKKTSNSLYETDLLTNYAGTNFKEVDLDSNSAYYVPNGFTNTNFETTVANPYPFSEDSVSANADGNFVQIRSLNNEISGNMFGTNLNYQNTKGLVLHAETSSAFGVATPTFDIPQGSIIKVSASMKVSSPITGSAYLRFVEDGTEALTEAFPAYTLKTTKSNQISSNATNITTNNYTTVSLLLKANTLIDSKGHIEFWIGDPSSKAVGTVVFDDLTFQTISYSEYDSSISNATKVDLSTITGTPSIANGTFNLFENETNETVFPAKPSSITRTEYDGTLVGAEESLVYGIINTNQAHFTAQNYTGIYNPGGLEGQLSDFALQSNNVFVIQNKVVTYQTFQTETFNLAANTVNEISFQLRAAGNVYAKVTNSNNTVLARFENISSNSGFSTRKFIVKTGSVAQTVKIVFGLGNSENTASGTAYFDNFATKTITVTDEAFALMQQTNIQKIADLKNGLFSKDSVSENDAQIWNPTFLNVSLTEGQSLGSAVAYGGVIDGTNSFFSLPTSFTNFNQNVLLIRNNGLATYNFTASLTESLASSKFYRISVWVKTVLSNTSEYENAGATLRATSDGDVFENIVTNNEFSEYVFLYSGSSSKTVTFSFGLVSPDNSVNGYALFTQPLLEELTETTFKTEANLLLLEVPPTNMINLSIATTEEEAEEETDNAVTSGFDFLFIPSLITALALIIAIVGFTVRRVRFKKIQFKYKSSYDRGHTLSTNVLRKEAEAIKKLEVAALTVKMDELAVALRTMEDKYSEILKEYRDAKASLTKEEKKLADAKQEKMFKAYSAKHSRIESQFESIKEKMAETESVEYLLALERKILRKNAKQSKAANQQLKQTAKSKKATKSESEITEKDNSAPNE